MELSISVCCKHAVKIQVMIDQIIHSTMSEEQLAVLPKRTELLLADLKSSVQFNKLHKFPVVSTSFGPNTSTNL